MLGLDLSFRFDRWYARLPRSPRDRGTLELCVVRPGPGQRATPSEVRLEPERGALGDRWGEGEEGAPSRPPGSEVSMMNVHVLRSVAGGDAERMPLSGDNLVVDLDLTEENLPPGTVLAVGEARLEVSPLPHRPCAKFARRFGPVAAKRIARANRLGRRGRGLMCHVRRAGTVRVGDAVVVESRPVQSR